jgi:hypothetical protein
MKSAGPAKPADASSQEWLPLQWLLNRQLEEYHIVERPHLSMDSEGMLVPLLRALHEDS